MVDLKPGFQCIKNEGKHGPCELVMEEIEGLSGIKSVRNPALLNKKCPRDMKFRIGAAGP